ncbi:hypothetical protein [Spiroplasma endosymbiont of Phycita roborella]
MINNNNFIKIGLIIGMIMSIILLISCIIYGIFTFFNYGWVTLYWTLIT